MREKKSGYKMANFETVIAPSVFIRQHSDSHYKFFFTRATPGPFFEAVRGRPEAGRPAGRQPQARAVSEGS